MKRKNEKDHRARKSMGAAEVFKQKRRERNAARPKQRWVPEETVDGLIISGHWTCEPA